MAAAQTDRIKAQLEAGDDLSDWELDEDDTKKENADSAAERRADADDGKENATPEQTKKESKYHADDANNQNLARNRLKIEEEKATWLCAKIDSHFTPKILQVARGFEKARVEIHARRYSSRREVLVPGKFARRAFTKSPSR